VNALRMVLCVLDPEPGELVLDVDDWDNIFEPEEEEYYCSTTIQYFCEFMSKAGS
jgi:hypothetical protein